MPVTYTFANATAAILLSQLDNNFATPITIGNVAVQLGNTVSTIGNVTLSNATISSLSAPITPAEGGTGLVTITANNVMLGNGTSNVQVVAPGTSGNVLTSNGTTWLSQTASTTTPGGSNTQVQYNNSGAFGGSSNFTFNGTTVTMANDASIHGLTVGQGGGSVAASTTVGYQAANSNTTGQNDVFGYQALYTNTTGNYNFAAGALALNKNTTGSSNIGIGTATLYNNTTASNNTAVGYQAGYSNTTGAPNTFIGYQSGYANTTGTDNTAVGASTLNSNTTGDTSVAVGEFALTSQTTASTNTAVGLRALNGTTTGGSNSAMGGFAMRLNTTGTQNCAFGYQALNNNTTASTNTAVGYQAGTTNTTGAGNLFLGCGAIGNSATDNYEIVLGYNATGKGSSTGFINPNSGGVYQGNNSTLWSVTSDQRLKKNIVDNTVGLSAITQIKVRNFEYRLPDEITELDKSNAVNITGVQLGPIAQEIAQVLPDCVKTESTGVMSVDSSNVIWHLVNAIKELNAEVQTLKSKVGA